MSALTAPDAPLRSVVRVACCAAILFGSVPRASAVTVLAYPVMNCNSYGAFFQGGLVLVPNPTGGTIMTIFPDYTVSVNTIVAWPWLDLAAGESVLIHTMFYDRNSNLITTSGYSYQDASRMLKYDAILRREWQPVGNVMLVAESNVNVIPFYAIVYIQSSTGQSTSVYALDASDNDFWCGG
jgi:hypothetical protein